MPPRATIQRHRRECGAPLAAMVAAAWLLAPASGQSGPPGPSPPPPPATTAAPGAGAKAQSADQAREEALASLVATLLPEPLTRGRLLEFTGRCWPKGDERTAAVDAVERYLAATAEARERIRRPAAILVEPAHAWDAVSRSYQPRHGAAYVALLEACRRWTATLDDAERTLLEALSLLPAASGAVPARQLRWERTLERDERPVHDPLASLRLDEVLDQLALDPVQRSAMTPDLDLWRDRASAALRQRRIRLDELAMERARLEARWGAWWREGASTPLRQEREEVLDSVARAERNTDTGPADVNAAAVRAVRARLGPAAQRQLDERTGRLLHPLVFDDSRALGRLLSRLSDAPGLDADQRVALIGLADEATTRLGPLELAALKPAAELTDAEEALQMDPSSPGAAIRVLELQRTMLGHAERRRRAVQELLRMDRGVVPAEPVTVAGQLDDALASVQARGRDDAARRTQLEVRLQELSRAGGPLPPEEPGGDNVRPGTPGAPETMP